MESLDRKAEGIKMAKHTIIHLSDLHIGRKKHEQDRTRVVFNYIAKSHPKIPVLITGDLTDSATKPQFIKTRKLLDKLAQTNPVLAVPGNHDYAWKGNFIRPLAWENWVTHLGSPLGWNRPEKPWMENDHEPAGTSGLGVWQHGPYAYFGIDSGDPQDKQKSARGYISENLAKNLKKTLKKYRGKTRIAFLHHHPFTRGVFTRLHGADRLMKALKKDCELLLFGHEHEYGIWWDDRDIPLIVSSHKTTNYMSKNCFMITIIEIKNAGTPQVSFKHRLEVMQE